MGLHKSQFSVTGEEWELTCLILYYVRIRLSSMKGGYQIDPN